VTWSVILEMPGQKPRHYASHRKQEDAVALALRLSEAYKPHGGKAFVRTPDSRDQLQITAAGNAVRDQPELPALGQNVHVIARRNG
jgi:hypothetical protein